MSSRPLKVFLCHASGDKPVVRELYQKLAAEGWIDPWLDEEKLSLGQHWTTVIEEAIDSADIVIIFLSRHSVHKEGFVQRELNYAWELSLEKPRETIFLIPFRLDDCEPPRYLRSRQWGDYFGEKKENTYETLLKSLKQRHEQKLHLEAEEQARLVELSRKQAEEKARLEAEARERQELEERIQKEAREKVRRELEERLRKEAEERARQEFDAQEKTKKEVEQSAHIERNLANKLVPSQPFVTSIPARVLAQDKDAEQLADAQRALERGQLEISIQIYGRLIKKGRLLDEVIHDLREATYRYTVDIIVWQTLGDAYNRANKLQDALDAYTKAEELRR